MYIKIEGGARPEDFRGKKIVLFGASSTGEKAVEEFENAGADIVGFCDNSPDKWGKTHAGYTVYSPDWLASVKGQGRNIAVMITSTYEDEIKGQLSEMGIGGALAVHMGVLYEKMPFCDFKNELLGKEEANGWLREMILSGEPFFVGRIGSTELETICNYLYFTGRAKGSGTPYTKNITNMICGWCGFFPPDHSLMDRLCRLYLDELPGADMLWCMWESKYEDRLYSEYCPDVLLSLYDDTGFPVDVDRPWTAALEGKRVLVVHPFEKSIVNNYKIREKLFSNPAFLPRFELKTLKAVQTLADSEDSRYGTWFDALDAMKRQMEETDFDVALIGAGAYGFPLAAHAKRIGRQALHIGGMLQLYFGIRGSYYDKFNWHNEYWTRPLEEERPKGYRKVEAGRYW